MLYLGIVCHELIGSRLQPDQNVGAAAILQCADRVADGGTVFDLLNGDDPLGGIIEGDHQILRILDGDRVSHPVVSDE